MRVLGDHERAQQTIEEVYLHAWAIAHDFDPGQGSPQAWLATQTHRRAVDRVWIEQTHGKRILHCVIDDERQRESIMLAYYGGLTHREVADRLGLPLAIVEHALRSGLTRLDFSVDAAAPNGGQPRARVPASESTVES